MGLCYWATLSTLARQFSLDNDLMTSSWVRKLHHDPSQYDCAIFDDSGSRSEGAGVTESLYNSHGFEY